MSRDPRKPEWWGIPYDVLAVTIVVAVLLGVALLAVAAAVGWIGP